MPHLKIRPASLVLLVVGTFLGYQLAFVHLQTEKGAGQVILSKRQFEHMLRSMNSETWNQQEAKVYTAVSAKPQESEPSDDSVSGSSDEDSRGPSHIPPDVGIYRNSSCRKSSGIVSRWFKYKFDENIRPEWSRENLLLEGETFRWWNSIQPGNESLRQVLNIAQELTTVAGVKSDTEDTCIRCAVVGNSANLLRSGYGAFISAHDLIFRMNKCPVHGGYADDVGNWTTHYFAYPESFYEEYLTNASLVFTPFKAEDLLWLRDSLRTQSTDNDLVEVKQFHLYNPQLMWHVTRSWGIGRGVYPSTGLLAVFYALYTCHEVDLFGFGPDREGRWDHYYDKDFKEDDTLFKRPVVHDARAELDLLSKLDSVGKIRIFKGKR